MRKFIAGFIVAVMLTLSVGVFADTRSIDVLFDNIKITLNGKEIKGDTEPLIYAGRTYLPIRTIAEALGIGVKWNEITNTAELTTVTGNVYGLNVPVKKNADTLELYKKIQGAYKFYNSMYDILKDIEKLHQAASSDVIDKKLSTKISGLDSVMMENYNKLQAECDYVKTLSKEATEKGIDISELTDISNKMRNAQSAYLSADENLLSYLTENDRNKYYAYYKNNTEKAIVYRDECADKIKAGLQKYNKLVE